MSVITIVIIAAFAYLRHESRNVWYGKRKSNDPIHVDESVESKTCLNYDLYGKRRVPDVDRTGVIVPEWSEDTRECDDFAKPIECDVRDGFNACFECVESRSSLRLCAHVNEDTPVFDVRANATIVLPKNTDTDKGYCLRDDLASQLKKLRDVESSVSKLKKSCNVFTGNWLLVRRSVDGDSSYNFVCQCKYPHLLTNLNGPQTACLKDVACNGHGRLDDNSSNGLWDVVAHGSCLCDNGWVGERSSVTGPYCREGTFAEFPTLFFGKRRSDFDIELNDAMVEPKFKYAINETRRDAGSVYLPNPCASPCQLKLSDDESFAYCADGFDLKNDGSTLRRVGVGIYHGRDYLLGNGGSYPNACLTFDAHDTDRAFALQYMSQSWNDGRYFAQELRIVVKKSTLRDVTNNAFATVSYTSYVDSLIESPNTLFDDFGVIWTFSHQKIATHRIEQNRTVLRITGRPNLHEFVSR